MPKEAPMDLEDLAERLDRQAAAIRSLRKRVTALEEAGASPSTPAPVVNPAPGVFVPSAQCLVCGSVKEPGRDSLTCKTCAAAWNAGIRGTAERMTFAACLNCSAAKAANTKMLCTPCSGAFKVWKAAQ